MAFSRGIARTIPPEKLSEGRKFEDGLFPKKWNSGGYELAFPVPLRTGWSSELTCDATSLRVDEVGEIFGGVKFSGVAMKWS